MFPLCKLLCIKSRPNPLLLEHTTTYSRHSVTGYQVLTCDKCKSFNTIKVSVLNGHDASICKDLLREVVDELSVDKAVEALTDDVLHLGAHLLLFSLLNVCHLHFINSLLHPFLTQCHTALSCVQCPMWGQTVQLDICLHGDKVFPVLQAPHRHAFNSTSMLISCMLATATVDDSLVADQPELV